MHEGDGTLKKNYIKTHWTVSDLEGKNKYIFHSAFILDFMLNYSVKISLRVHFIVGRQTMLSNPARLKRATAVTKKKSKCSLLSSVCKIRKKKRLYMMTTDCAPVGPYSNASRASVK